MKTDGTNLLMLTISAFCRELIQVAPGHLDELQKAEKYAIRWSL